MDEKSPEAPVLAQFYEQKRIFQFSAVKVSLPILLFATMNALKFINESRTYLKIKKFKISVPEELQLLILRN